MKDWMPGRKKLSCSNHKLFVHWGVLTWVDLQDCAVWHVTLRHVAVTLDGMSSKDRFLWAQFETDNCLGFMVTLTVTVFLCMIGVGQNYQWERCIEFFHHNIFRWWSGPYPARHENLIYDSISDLEKVLSFFFFLPCTDMCISAAGKKVLYMK